MLYDLSRTNIVKVKNSFKN